jgi:multicomponent Na+:H+ antiporter subunit E
MTSRPSSRPSAGVLVPLLPIVLVALWIALWGELTWANLLGGIAIAAIVVVVAGVDRSSMRPVAVRPLWTLRYVGFVLWSLVVSNLRLAREIVSFRRRTFTAIVAVEMRCASDAVVNVVANSITLTPGTITVDVVRQPEPDHDLAILYVHAIYGRDPAEVRRDVLVLERLALRAFGTASEIDWAERRLEETS